MLKSRHPFFGVFGAPTRPRATETDREISARARVGLSTARVDPARRRPTCGDAPETSARARATGSAAPRPPGSKGRPRAQEAAVPPKRPERAVKLTASTRRRRGRRAAPPWPARTPNGRSSLRRIAPFSVIFGRAIFRRRALLDDDGNDSPRPLDRPHVECFRAGPRREDEERHGQ